MELGLLWPTSWAKKSELRVFYQWKLYRNSRLVRSQKKIRNKKQFSWVQSSKFLVLKQRTSKNSTQVKWKINNILYRRMQTSKTMCKKWCLKNQSLKTLKVEVSIKDLTFFWTDNTKTEINNCFISWWWLKGTSWRTCSKLSPNLNGKGSKANSILSSFIKTSTKRQTEWLLNPWPAWKSYFHTQCSSTLNFSKSKSSTKELTKVLENSESNVWKKNHSMDWKSLMQIFWSRDLKSLKSFRWPILKMKIHTLLLRFLSKSVKKKPGFCKWIISFPKYSKSSL